MSPPFALGADVGKGATAADALDTLLALAPGGDEQALLGCATRAVVALLGERGSCVLFDGTPRVVLSTHAPTLRNWPIDLALYPEIRLAAEQRRPVFVEDVRVDPRMKAARGLMPHGLRSVAAVPILLADRCLGVLVAQSMVPRREDGEVLARAAMVGKLLGHLVDAGRLRRASPHLDPHASLLEPGPAPGAPPVVLAAAGERTLRIPVLQANPPDDARRVLVVEDDPEHAALVAAILARDGHRVETVHDGVSAIHYARKERPHAILLDVCMPVIDGFATAKQLKADPLTAEIPILFLSGCDDLMARVEGLRLGADFLVKPFFAPELLARVERALEQLDAHSKLRGQAHTDELTGLGNLRFLHERLALELSRAERYGTLLTMVMIDVDGLKRTNDRYGHAMGSRLLAEVGRVLAEESRDTDVAVRYGGDEYVVLLPHASLDDGLRFSERVLAQVSEIDLGGPEVSVSMGVASLGPPGGAHAAGTLLEQADAAAYRAKREGGGRVCPYLGELDVVRAR